MIVTGQSALNTLLLMRKLWFHNTYIYGNAESLEYVILRHEWKFEIHVLLLVSTIPLFLRFGNVRNVVSFAHFISGLILKKNMYFIIIYINMICLEVDIDLIGCREYFSNLWQFRCVDVFIVRICNITFANEICMFTKLYLYYFCNKHALVLHIF